MVDSIHNSLELFGKILNNTTFGTRGEDFADLSNDSFQFVGNIDKISLGGIGMEDMVDSIDNVLKLGGSISDDTTFGTSRGQDMADLSNDSLDFVCNIQKISLGDGSIGVEDVVDSVDNVLKLGGNISDDTTFGTSRGQDMADLSNDSFQFVGNIDKISLGDGSIG